MTQATRTSWKTLPSPSKRETLKVQMLFSDLEGERMQQGHIPDDMNDKWFIFFENGWLHFHRSWTGAHIYALRLDGSPGGVRFVEGWASRDEEQYNSPGIEHDQRFVCRLIQSYFGD